VPKDRKPRLTLPYWIAQALNLPDADAIKWMTQIGLPALSDRHEVAKWLGHLLSTCDLSEQPRAYHDGSYVDILDRQKPLFERFCQGVFLDKADSEGNPTPFTYINETIAYRSYITLCKMLNGGRGVMADQRFRADLGEWMEANAPHIQRKEAWQGQGSRHVRLWRNTRVGHLRLAEANDSEYLIGEPGHEWWVGPDI
jgi:hypothetical protein